MTDVDSTGLVFAALVLVLAYAVRGTAGFGGQAVAVPLLTLVLPLQVVVPAVTLLTVLASLTHWRTDWRKIAWREVARLLPFTLLGVLVGLYIFQQADARSLTKAFGAFVALYALFSLRTAASPAVLPRRWLRPAGALLGAASGALGAIFGAAAGPLYAIYFNALRMERDAFRVTVTTMLMFQGALRVAGYAQIGFYSETVLLLAAAGLPMMLIGSRVGGWLAGRLDQRRFDQGIGLLLLAIGVALLFK